MTSRRQCIVTTTKLNRRRGGGDEVKGVAARLVEAARSRVV